MKTSLFFIENQNFLKVHVVKNTVSNEICVETNVSNFLSSCLASRISRCMQMCSGSSREIRFHKQRHLNYKLWNWKSFYKHVRSDCSSAERHLSEWRTCLSGLHLWAGPYLSDEVVGRQWNLLACSLHRLQHAPVARGTVTESAAYWGWLSSFGHRNKSAYKFIAKKPSTCWQNACSLQKFSVAEKSEGTKIRITKSEISNEMSRIFLKFLIYRLQGKSIQQRINSSNQSCKKLASSLKFNV